MKRNNKIITLMLVSLIGTVSLGGCTSIITYINSDSSKRTTCIFAGDCDES